MAYQLAGTVPVDGGKGEPHSSPRRSSTILSSQNVSSTDSSEALSPPPLTSSSSPASSVSLASRSSRSTLEHSHRFSILVPDGKHDEESISEAVGNVVKSLPRNHQKLFTNTQSDQHYYPMFSLTESGSRNAVSRASDPTISQRFPKRWSPSEHRRGELYSTPADSFINSNSYRCESFSDAQENNYVLKSSPFPVFQSNSGANAQFASRSVTRSATPSQFGQYYSLPGDITVEGLPYTGDDLVPSFLPMNSTPRCSLADTTDLGSLFERKEAANDDIHDRSYSYPLTLSEEPNSAYELGMDDEMENLLMQPPTKDQVANPKIEKSSRQSRALLSDSDTILQTQTSPCHTQRSNNVPVSNAIAVTAVQSSNYSHMQNTHCYSDLGVTPGSGSGVFCNEFESHDLGNHKSDGLNPQPVSASIDSEEDQQVGAFDGPRHIDSAIEAALENIYGSDPRIIALLPKLSSIFNDGTFCSADDDRFDVSSFGEGYSQNVGGSSVSGTSNGLSTELSPYTSLSASGTPGNTGWDQNGAHPGQGQSLTPKSATARGKPVSSQRVLRRLRCHFNARNPHKYCVNNSTGDTYHTCAKSGSLNIQHLM
jgi:hypothetical protein